MERGGVVENCSKIGHLCNESCYWDLKMVVRCTGGHYSCVVVSSDLTVACIRTDKVLPFCSTLASRIGILESKVTSYQRFLLSTKQK